MRTDQQTKLLARAYVYPHFELILEGAPLECVAFGVRSPPPRGFPPSGALRTFLTCGAFFFFPFFPFFFFFSFFLFLFLFSFCLTCRSPRARGRARREAHSDAF